MKRGKRYNLVRQNIAIGMLLAMLNSILFADIKIDRNIPQNTSVDRAQNGVNIVNINTPNSRGISVNDYSEFRTSDPTVFNNFGSGVGRSYLAGMMAANPNLTKEQAARLILNRVGGNNRVEIENWLEVMSENKTDIIFSSNQGFYLNNTGFINFDKVIFTTSRVDLDGNGDLLPFNIRSGRIDIGRDGINAEGVRYLALLSRQMYIDGQIYAKDADVDLIAGDFDYNPNTGDYTKQGVNNNELLISSSAFGSIYGNQIKIVGVNGNIGVAGDAISERVLKLNADGSITTNKTQSKEATEIKAKEFVQEGSTYTEGKLTVEADNTNLKGTGTQAQEIEISGNLENNTTVYSKGNITVGKDVKNNDQLLSEGNLDIKGNLESDSLVYGKNEVKIGKDLTNKSDLQSEGTVSIGGNVSNTGKVISDRDLNIKGNANNAGTLYGKDKVQIDKNLTNSGTIQTTGNLSAKDTVNTGTIIAENNINVENLDNSGEIVSNQTLKTKNIENKSTGKLSTGAGIVTAGAAKNYGEITTNKDFLISSNLENYNKISVGGLVDTKNLTNTGELKVSEKIKTSGITFNNSGKILTTLLEVNNNSILNTNEIIVLERADLTGSSVVNNGYISAPDIVISSLGITNTGRIEADNEVRAQNTVLNNSGYIGTNSKIDLSSSNVINSGTLESGTIDMYNLSGYTNTNLIRGGNVSLTTTGNLMLTGTLHGENWLQVHGYDILNNGATTGTGYIEIKGRNITNNTELASNTIVVDGTGNIINNYIITGENGRISGYNIVNNDLIVFSDQLGLTASDKITNNAGKTIYGGNLLDAEFNTFENLRGELLSTGIISLRGNYLLNSVGTIQSSNDISLNITKIDNVGEVTGLTDYEIYYKTWDGQIYTEAEFNSSWLFGREENAGSNAGRVNHFNSILALANAQGGYNSLLDYYYGAEIRSRFVTDGEFGVAVSDTLMYPGESIKGILKSNAQTTYANISAGNNIQITGNELNNKDGKISAGNTAELTVGTITNTTTLGAGIQLKDGYEEVEWHGINSTTRPVRYRRLVKNGDLSYVTGQASVIEANNLIINTGTLILTAELPAGSQIIDGSTTSGGSVTGKTVSTGTSNGSGIINVVKNMSGIESIVATGILPIDPLAAQSSLFSTSQDSTSKYLLETRSKYINLKDFYGSDYYLSRLGYDENGDWNKARRLGDAYYEYLLVTRAISDKLGTRFINGLSDSELMKAMLDNSVELQKDLQLSVGVALTPDQVKALKSDIIWYEYEMVNGEKVLVPKVYLSQATLATIDTDGRNKVGGLELTVINAEELRNNGQVIGNGGVTYVNAGRVYNVTNTNELSEIRGNEVTVIATVGNIENIGGRIKGIESVALVAENGDIINSSSIRTSLLDKGEFHRSETDHILSIGSIESEGTTYIEGKNYISEAGYVSGKTVVIDAKENILIGSATLSGEDKFGNAKDNYQYFSGTQKVGSEIVGTDNVILGAGNNIDIKGSTIGSDGTIQMTAKNVNIENEKETTYLEAKAKYGGTFEKTEAESRRSNEYAAASTIIGNNIIIDAENDINVRASNLIAVKDGLENTGGNISLAAGNNVNILVDTLENSSYSKIKTSGFSTSFASGGGSFTAGVSYNRSSLEQQGNGTTVAVSTIVSEGNTLIDAGNRVRTEAMQANIGENLIIRGVNGVELLDAQEVYEEKVKQKSTSIGVSVNVGFTPAQLANTVSNVADNVKDYGFDNPSQTINTLGNGLQDLRDLGGLSSNLRSWYGGNGYISTKDILQNGNLSPDNLRNAAKGLVSASVSASYSQSSYESNISGTTSVAGNINVGKNFILQSDGDVILVNQKINVGENFVVDAKNFEVRAGENTYKNDTKSSSTGGSVGYDIVNQNVIGGLNVSGGNSNTTSKYYDNSIINVGGTFQLTTKEDALFTGVNVKADKINFDIGRDLTIISLQDEYKSDGKNWGVGLNVSGKLPGTETQTGSARPSIGGNYGENHQDSKWTGNQTTILAENGGNIKVGETLTNIGSAIGSLNDQNKLSIEANKVVVENLKDYNEGSNYGVGLSGIGLGSKKQGNTTPVGQTSIQYGSHDKQQDSNATFVNTEVTEAGKKLNLEELGINTDINKAQVVTKDQVVEQIDTVLHTDLLNETTRNQVIKDLNGLVQLPADIVRAIQATAENEGSNFLDNLVGTLRNTDANLIKYQEMNKQYKELKDLPDELKAEKSEKLANEMANKLKDVMGIDDDIKIIISFIDEPKENELGAYERKDAKETGVINIFINVKEVDVSDMEQVYNALGYEMNHYNPSNPYVYDKTEQQAGQGNPLEEFFTSIGRNSLDGSGNSFYENILNGSNVLNTGNNKYSFVDKEMLDFKHEGGVDKTDDYLNLKIDQCLGNAKCINKTVSNGNAAEKGITDYINDTMTNKGKKPKNSIEFFSDPDKIIRESNYEKQEDGSLGLKKNVVAQYNEFKGSKDDLKNTLEIKGIIPSKELLSDGINCNKNGKCTIYASSTDYTKAQEMVNQYGWTNVSVVEKDKGYYQVQEIYTNYLHENGGWHPRNAEALGVPEGRTVMYPNQVPGITKSEAGNYTNILDTAYLVNDLAQIYGTYLTSKIVSESPVYNETKGLTPQKYYDIKNNVGLTPELAEAINRNYGTNYLPVNPSPVLTVNEVDALVKYTGSSYYENLNNSLRGMDDMWIENKEINKNLNNIMNKFSLQKDMVLYRGTSKDGLGELKNLKPEEMIGKTFTESAYMSTSMKPNIGSDFSDGVTLTINAPKGTSGLNVSKFSTYSEAEILLNAGQKMKITNAKIINGELHLEVEIVK